MTKGRRLNLRPFFFINGSDHEEELTMMLGLGSVEMALVYWLCIVASAVCVIYGAINWNRGGEADKVTADDDD